MKTEIKENDTITSLIDSLGNSGYAFTHNNFLYISVSYGDKVDYFIKIDLDNSLGVYPLKSEEFYNNMKRTNPGDIVTYVCLVNDVHLVYVKDSYIHNTNLSVYNPSEVSDVLKLFISKVVLVADTLISLKKCITSYGFLISR